MKKILFISLLLFLLQPTFVSAKEKTNQEWEALNRMSDQILQLGKQHKYAEAKKIIANFSPIFLKATSEQKLTMKEMKMIIYTYEQAEEALTATAMDDNERIHKLIQLRLAVNAASSEHQPLWRETEKVVMEPLNQAINAIKNDEHSQFQMHLNDFFSKYEMIRPALVIDLQEHDMQRLESYIRFLENYRNKIEESASKQKQLVEIQHEFQALFQDKEWSSAEPGLIEIIYTIGGIIAVTLIYVGWRKYKGDKQRKKVRDKQ